MKPEQLSPRFRAVGRASIFALFACAGLIRVSLGPAAQPNPGDLVVVDWGGNLYRYEPAGGTVSTLATVGGSPTDISLGEGTNAGRAWLSNYGNGSIQLVDLATGLVTPIVTGGPSFIGVAYHDGLIYSTAYDAAVRVYDAGAGSLLNTYTNPAGGRIFGIRFDSRNNRMLLSSDPGDGSNVSEIVAMTLGGAFTNLAGVPGVNVGDLALEPNGNILIGADEAVVQRLDVHSGNSLSVVFSGAPLDYPDGVVVDPVGHVYVSSNDSGGHLIRMNPDATGVTDLGALGSPGGKLYSLAVVPGGNWPAAVYSQPQNQTAQFGANAGFAAFGIGTPPLSYQWLFNGARLADDGRIAGAWSNTLVIASVAAGDAGTYQMIVTNAYGSATSTVAVLFVPPTFLSLPLSQAGNPGATLTFCAMAVGNPPPAAYQWQFNGTNLTDNGRITGSQSNCLVVANLQVGDAGLYQVVVTNAYFSMTSAAATLEVNQAPVVLVPPQSQNVPLGATDTVAVIASAWPPPGYQWRYDSANLADSARITGAQSSALIIAGALAGDAGNYDVIIT